MTTYNTNNPVPSVDVRDLYDNAQNLDNLVNGPLSAYADRLGVSRKSYKGMEQDFSAFLSASGFELPALTYVNGSPLVVARPTQLISRSGVLYSVKPSESFPATLTGTWATDQSRLVLRTDQDLRQDLANQVDPAKGAGLVGYEGTTVAESLDALFSGLSNIDTQSVDNLAGLRLVTFGELVVTKGYTTFGDGGHGAYFYDSTDTTSADNGVTIIVGVYGRRWKLLHNGVLRIEQAGGRAGSGSFINGALSLALSLAGVREIKLGAGTYLVNAAAAIVLPAGKTISGIPGAGSSLEISGAASGGAGGAVFYLKPNNTIKGLTINCFAQTTGFIFALATSIAGVEYVNIEDMITYFSKGFLTDENSSSFVATNIRVKSVSNRVVQGNGIVLRDAFAFLECRDIAIDYLANSVAQNFIGFDISSNEGCLFDNCEVTGSKGIIVGTSASQIAFRFTNSKAIYMRRSFADACGGRGFVFNNCQYIRLSLCSTSLCDDVGAAFLSSSDIQSTNLYVGGRRGIAGATAGIPGILLNACTRAQLGGTEVVNATGDGILTAATSTRVVISGGLMNGNGGWGIVTGAGSACLITGVLTANNTAGNYSLATAADHFVASQLTSGALANVTGPGAG